ncbi:hypothetical protein S7711_11277 [Stachybotrys chartarum IBT 7711]|uniref:Uncharacterized protein n=1 Tax=Stachybotrys chartarum (strain CBS 109288 / IBT 7711) TaxID=1280523 RepID=A0A084AZV4_STACB|nr:hypothetical protein S7711_11277 [Stachybotrys chartarum IBT 7711]KFA51447.1 hypothetical protein S40293_10691 [Stachybotrys chartarum IBT 40293]
MRSVTVITILGLDPGMLAQGSPLTGGFDTFGDLLSATFTNTINVYENDTRNFVDSVPRPIRDNVTAASNLQRRIQRIFAQLE